MSITDKRDSYNKQNQQNNKFDRSNLFLIQNLRCKSFLLLTNMVNLNWVNVSAYAKFP
ncbi:MAG: hypothetical protein LN545_04700 [Candidatus Megaira endosymbiont of Carteria cerasiformis]|nr:hypothetical protein [Candidatus Megaera polyxenophila]